MDEGAPEFAKVEHIPMLEGKRIIRYQALVVHAGRMLAAQVGNGIAALSTFDPGVHG